MNETYLMNITYLSIGCTLYSSYNQTLSNFKMKKPQRNTSRYEIETCSHCKVDNICMVYDKWNMRNDVWDKKCQCIHHMDLKMTWHFIWSDGNSQGHAETSTEFNFIVKHLFKVLSNQIFLFPSCLLGWYKYVLVHHDKDL